MDLEKFTEDEKKTLQTCFDEKVKNVVLGIVNEGTIDSQTKRYGVILYFDPYYKNIKIITDCSINDKNVHDIRVLDQSMKDKAVLIFDKIKEIFDENKIVYKECAYSTLYANPIILDFSF